MIGWVGPAEPRKTKGFKPCVTAEFATKSPMFARNTFPRTKPDERSRLRGRQPDRDRLLLTIMFRHGPRLSEAIDLPTSILKAGIARCSFAAGRAATMRRDLWGKGQSWSHRMLAICKRREN